MALDNSIGVVGVAPGLNGNDVYSWAGMECQSVIDGIEEAILLEVDVINMSFFTPIPSSHTHDGIADAVSKAWDAGIVMVAAGGNTNTGSSGYTEEVYPASYSQVIGVSGVNEQGVLADDSPCGIRSRYGPHIDLAAPFWAVSTSPTDQYLLQCGTSYAAPHVTGAVALIKSLNPNLSPEQIFEILTSTANKAPLNGQERTDEYGYGILDTYSALFQVIENYNDPPAISGSTVVCNTNTTFTLHNLPPGFTVSWDYTENLTSPVRCTPQPGTHCITLRAASSAVSDIGWVQATVRGPCSTALPPTKHDVWVGAPAQPTEINGFPYNGMEFGGDSYYYFSYFPLAIQGVNYYEWSVGGGTIVSGQGTEHITVLTNAAGEQSIPFNVSVRVGNACGVGDWLHRTGYIVGGSGGGTLAVHPNPTSYTLTIAEVEPANDNIPWVLRLMSKQGAVVVNVTAVLPKTINVQGLQPGVYVLHARRGQYVEQQVVIIE